jgi:hypothetical protein
MVVALPTHAVGQQKRLQDQLIGAWTLVFVETVAKDGTKIPYLEGGNIKVLLVFTGKYYSLQIITEFPKIASNDRLQTSPEENKAVAHGVISNWGMYSVSEEEKVLTLHNERSSFPNQNGAIGKRAITSISATELKFSVPITRTGNTQNLAWSRME